MGNTPESQPFLHEHEVSPENKIAKLIFEINKIESYIYDLEKGAKFQKQMGQSIRPYRKTEALNKIEETNELNRQIENYRNKKSLLEERLVLLPGFSSPRKHTENNMSESDVWL